MPRSARQSKILELISIYEICTQDELVAKLRELNFDITQATVSRDIKELGLIKKISTETGKSKYVFPENSSSSSNKYLYILKEATISIKAVKNFVIIKTLKGLASSLTSVIDSYNLEDCLGVVNGDDTIMAIFNNNEDAIYASHKLENIINN